MGPRINERITDKTVQLIDETGENRGVIATNMALQMAADLGLDLVEINANSTPSVAKLIDYGKFKYDRKKKNSEAKKNQKTTEMKEVWVKPFIEENDLNIKMKKVFEFLADGDKVKISVMTRGHKKVLALGRAVVPELFEKIIKMSEGHGTLESRSKPDEQTKSIMLAPVK